MRGEDPNFTATLLIHWETPPRAWGRRTSWLTPDRRWRNTPTCVGKTHQCPPRGHGSGKHPHVRGEDSLNLQRCRGRKETPPRAWGRLETTKTPAEPTGNTPTCVGKTRRLPAQHGKQQKHPHVRGEDFSIASAGHPCSETPPRAWGRPSLWQMHRDGQGNTPTCVGKTPTYCERARV